MTDLTPAIALFNEWADRLYPNWDFRLTLANMKNETLGFISLIAEKLGEGRTITGLAPDMKANDPSPLDMEVAQALDDWFYRAWRSGEIEDRIPVLDSQHHILGTIGMSALAGKILRALWAAPKPATPAATPAPAPVTTKPTPTPTPAAPSKPVPAPDTAVIEARWPGLIAALAGAAR